MQTFYIIIKKDYLSFFEKNGNSYERVYLGGNPEFEYSLNSVNDNSERLCTMIVEEYNLDTIAEMDFVVINNENNFISEVMTKALNQNIKEIISIDSLIKTAMINLSRDQKLYIQKYGIHFDGKSYFLRDSNLYKEEFSLVSYGLKDDMLMKFLS